MSEELHVAGIVVHAYPAKVQAVASAIAGFAGAEIHATAPDGKLIVTLEGSSTAAIAACMDAIQQLDSVLSASLVYQHGEPLQAMLEEVSVEDHPPGLH
jgi:nitrate reductase NapD